MRTSIVSLLAAAAVVGATEDSVHVRSAKMAGNTFTRPQQYTMGFVLTLPWVDLSVPQVIRADLASNKLKLSSFNDLTDTLMTPGLGKSYQHYVAKDTMRCLSSDDSGSVESSSVIPDPTQFRFVGTGPCPQPATTGGAHVVEVGKSKYAKFTSSADVRAFRERTFRGGAQTCMRYEDNYMEGDLLFARVTYLTSPDGTPVQLTWQGHNNQTGSHRDTYVYDVYSYAPTVNQTELQPPSAEECPSAPTFEATKGRVDFAPVVDHARKAISKLSRPGSQARLEHALRDFALAHGKTYRTEGERAHRSRVLDANTRMIEAHNANPKSTYTMRVNHLADHEPHEYRSGRCGCHRGADEKLIQAAHLKKELYFVEGDLPTYVNWKEQGVVTRVKDQSFCGSCWSFAAASALETAQARKAGTFVTLSEQNMVDCAWPNNTSNGIGGCGGSDAIVAWQWLLDNQGGKLATAQSYPYLGVDDYCKPESAWTAGSTITGYTTCPAGDLTCAKTLISKYGSAAIAIDASHPSFGFYAHGTYYEPACGNTLNDLDHAVLAVGYGTDEQGEEYLLVQNSWSNLWGSDSLNNGVTDGGLIRMSVKDNNCGVLTELAVPHV